MKQGRLLVVVVALGCGGGGGTHAVQAPAPPAWTIAGQPAALMCWDNPLALPAPAGPRAAAAPRALPRADAIRACSDQASVAAACDCLVKSAKDWAGDVGLSAPLTCAPQAPANADAQLVHVTSQPGDGSKAGGEAFVFVARHGVRWSPIAAVEAAPEIDLSETPQASDDATIDRVQSHALASGTLYWIESHRDSEDKDTGDTDHDGEAHGTVCEVPADGAPYCTRPVALATWTYAFSQPHDDQPDTCTIDRVATYTATVDPTSITVTLAHGSDAGGVAGRYTY